MSALAATSSEPPVNLVWPKLSAFARRYGKPQVKLALYAALPLRLTPELLNLIRVNFVPDAHFITEADILLSDLVIDRGGGYYEFPLEIRQTLLREMRDTLGQVQLLRVADFLYKYCEHKMCEELTEVERDFLQAQKWAALSYLSPEAAAVCLAGQLNKELQNRDGDRTRQVIGLIRLLEAPLRGAHGFARYAAGLGLILDKKKEAAKIVFGSMNGMDADLQVGNIILPAPVKIAGIVENGQMALAEMDNIDTNEQYYPEAREKNGPVFTHFEIDVYISYAHIDNQPLTAGEHGWVTQFRSSLKTLLSMRLGRDCKIFVDEKLQGNDVLSDEIFEHLRKTAVFVAIVTPRYINSEWCIHEIADFCRSAAGSGGVFVDNRSRIFKVLKAPIASEQSLPEVMQDVLGYEFFTYENGIPLELNAEYGEKYGQDFNRKINKLSFEIAELLRHIPQTKKNSAASETHTRASTDVSGDGSFASQEQLVNETTRSIIKQYQSGTMSRADKRAAVARFEEAAATIDNLLALQPSVERWSLKGSMHKRWAMIANKTGQGTQLRSMADAYRHAYELATAEKSSNTFYPLHNLIAAEIALKWCQGSGKKGKSTRKQLDALFRELASSMTTSARNSTNFWIMSQEADYRLLKSLGNLELNSEEEHWITSAYLRAQRRGGSPGVLKSIIEHAGFFLFVAREKLPKGDVRDKLCEALERLIDGLQSE